MKAATKLKIVGVFFGVVLILNMLLVAFRITSWGVFWLVLAIVAAISYWGIPWLKRRMN
ncbi:MAG: hypothetical protein WCV90_05225 [Candidatus Woesearchaeota archaeon]|jgi:hypothetical protein